MALSVIAVSISVSPLRMADWPTDMFITSAPSRLPASSNDDWVRVEASKNRLIWVRPRSDVRFFSTWRLSSTNSSARSSRPEISSRESPSIPNRCRWLRTNEDFGAMVIKGSSIGGTRQAGKGIHSRAFAAKKADSPPLRRICAFHHIIVNTHGKGSGNRNGCSGVGSVSTTPANRAKEEP